MPNSNWKILEPIKIGSFVCKNRIIMAAHSYGYMDSKGLPTNQLLHYLEERARGGVGMLIMGGTSVSSPETALEGSYLSINDDIIPWYKKIEKKIHKHGTLLLDQLMHAGGYVDPNEGTVTLAPSPIPEEITCAIPIELTEEQIKLIEEEFLLAAIRAKQGGLDGVEIKCDQGLLLHQFLSPFFNRRIDEYGGSLENRSRIIKNIIQKIRTAIPENFIIGVRISADSFDTKDLTKEDGVNIAQDLNKLGMIDYIHVNGSTNATFRGYFLNHGDSSLPLRNFSQFSKEIKNRVTIPVISASMIMTPHDAEHIVSSGMADLVAMTRSQIADPEIVKKIREGREDDIRPCVLSNQGCIGNHWKGRGVHCIHNVSAGREKEFGSRSVNKTKNQKNILVVGGGVAGLEFARVAAMRGHTVDLFEKKNVLGGQLLLASQMPYRHNFIGIVNFLEGQLKKLKVNIHKGINISSDELRSVKEDYDVFVIATGSSLYIPENYENLDKAALTIDQMLEREADIGLNVAVVDIDWRQNALSIAEWLLQRGKNVTVISPVYSIGANLDVVTRTSYYSRIYNRAKFMPLTNLVSFSESKLVIRNVLTNDYETINGIDNVIFVTGAQPNSTIFTSLKKELDGMIYQVGDCFSPRGIPEAMLEANHLARKI